MTTAGKILVIDDVSEVGESVYAAAAALDIPWATLNDESALPKLFSADTTLILFDPILQKKDGTEVIRFLGEHQCKASIVLTSGDPRRATESLEKLAVTYGLSIAGHLLKPFRPTDLEFLLRQSAQRQAPSAARQKPGIDIDDREFRSAVDRNEFVLHYQPQINIEDGSIVGLAAFVRWNHPQRGLIFPDSFLGGIRALGHFEELGWLIADRGLSEIGQFSRPSREIPRLTLKVPVESLRNNEFPDLFASLARNYGVPTYKVAFDVSGAEAFDPMTSTLDVLTRLRMKDVHLTVGNYGCGNVRIQHLREISATYLKIDRTFVQNMLANERDRTMVQKIILIAHELNMKAIAEGVETEQQLEFLRRKGCDYAQGYFFSLPLHPERMSAWLKAYRPRYGMSR